MKKIGFGIFAFGWIITFIGAVINNDICIIIGLLAMLFSPFAIFSYDSIENNKSAREGLK